MKRADRQGRGQTNQISENFNDSVSKSYSIIGEFSYISRNSGTKILEKLEIMF